MGLFPFTSCRCCTIYRTTKLIICQYTAMPLLMSMMQFTTTGNCIVQVPHYNGDTSHSCDGWSFDPIPRKWIVCITTLTEPKIQFTCHLQSTCATFHEHTPNKGSSHNIQATFSHSVPKTVGVLQVGHQSSFHSMYVG